MYARSVPGPSGATTIACPLAPSRASLAAAADPLAAAAAAVAATISAASFITAAVAAASASAVFTGRTVLRRLDVRRRPPERGVEGALRVGHRQSLRRGPHRQPRRLCGEGVVRPQRRLRGSGQLQQWVRDGSSGDVVVGTTCAERCVRALRSGRDDAFGRCLRRQLIERIFVHHVHLQQLRRSSLHQDPAVRRLLTISRPRRRRSRHHGGAGEDSLPGVSRHLLDGVRSVLRRSDRPLVSAAVAATLSSTIASTATTAAHLSQRDLPHVPGRSLMFARHARAAQMQRWLICDEWQWHLQR